jgi:hypothetical protein
LSGIGLCDELTPRPEESYWPWCVVLCDQETSWMRKPWPTGGLKKERKREKGQLNTHVFQISTSQCCVS